MKLPHIQDNFIKIVQGTTPSNMKEANVGEGKGKNKVGKTTGNTKPKKKLVVSDYVIRKRSIPNTPPFF